MRQLEPGCSPGDGDPMCAIYTAPATPIPARPKPSQPKQLSAAEKAEIKTLNKKVKRGDSGPEVQRLQALLGMSDEDIAANRFGLKTQNRLDEVLKTDMSMGVSSNKKTEQLPHENDYDQFILSSAKKHHVPPEILKAKIRVESSFDKDAANSANIDGSTTVGLGQFTEKTARNLGLTVNPEIGVDERRNPETTIDAQARYLRELYDQNGKYGATEEDKWRFALASYNIGPRKVQQRILDSSSEMDIEDISELEGKLVYSDPRLGCSGGTYVQKIMGISGEVGGFA
ncbi:MAG TPA: transglycosylase SLT domain-containing protein, partial [Methanosarcina sp.]|nr:transglycosylase SLT domain-containing protein [Methanosarcina sp.]